jgi:drug/metabolite transporter (DMT)-like permease
MIKKQLPHFVLYCYLAMIIANVIWAAAGPVIKLTLDYLPPFTFLFFRFLLVSLLLLPYTLLQLAKTKVYIKDYWKIALLGLLSQSSIGFIFLGLKYTTAVDAAIIGSIGVVMSMAAGHYFFYEKINKGLKIGVVLALIGTFVVILEPLFTPTGSEISISTPLRIWGNFLIFLNNITFLVYIIWSKISMGVETKIIKTTLHFIHLKPMKGRYSAGLLSALTFYVGLLSMIPLAIFENLGVFGPVYYDLTQLPADAILGLLYMAIFSSIVAYSLFEWSLKGIGVSDTAIMGYLSSLFGIPFAYLMLGEVPTLYSMAGALIIALGVIIAEVAAHFSRRRGLFGLLKKKKF